MAQNRKKAALEERLAQIKEEIERLTDKLESLKNEKTNTEKEILKMEINELCGIVKASGKSMDDVRNLLENPDGKRSEA